MVNQKVTPEIIKFINSNHKLAATELSGIIEKRFNLKITSQAINPYVVKARAAAAANNNAKVEAVREKILDSADKWANKYLQDLDEEVAALKKLITDCKGVKIESAKDRIAISQAYQKSLMAVLDFVKPEKNFQIKIESLSDEEIDKRLVELMDIIDSSKTEIDK
jgi:hypothetical protein